VVFRKIYKVSWNDLIMIKGLGLAIIFFMFGIVFVSAFNIDSNGNSNNSVKIQAYMGENSSDDAMMYGKNFSNSAQIRERERIQFSPYQKRNESECLENCKCVGAVMSCPVENGKVMSIGAGNSGNSIIISVNKTQVKTQLEIEQDNNENNLSRTRVRLNNGENVEVKIMPDTASEIALQRLRLRNCNESNNCSIELKEVGKGNSTKLAYEIQIKRHSKILGIFQKKMQVQAQVNAETGEVIQAKKPWWAFLASETDELN
jgi:uncharacterized membrane protein YkoI